MIFYETTNDFGIDQTNEVVTFGLLFWDTDDRYCVSLEKLV